MEDQKRNFANSAYLFLHNVIRLHYLHSRGFFEKIGIYPGQHALLVAIDRREGQSQKELADYISVKPATVAVMIQRMERAGLLYKKPDPSDRRAFHIFLTENGKEKKMLLDGVFSRMEEECFQDFTEAELDKLAVLLSKVEQNLSKAVTLQNQEHN